MSIATGSGARVRQGGICYHKQATQIKLKLNALLIAMSSNRQIRLQAINTTHIVHVYSHYHT